MSRSRTWMGGLSMLVIVGCRGDAGSASSQPPPITEPAEPAPRPIPEPSADPTSPSDNEQPSQQGLASKVNEQVAAARAEQPEASEVADEGPSIAEALAAPPSDSSASPERPTGLRPPTEAEFKAWDRKDPAAEKHLYKWDRANLDTMLDYYADLECFRHQVMTAGTSYMTGKSNEVEWTKFKRVMVPKLDKWLTQLFADQPRVVEKSKLIGNILEIHELVMHTYVVAYNDKDRLEIDKSNALFMVVTAKVRKYVDTLGGTLTSLSALECQERAAKKKAAK